MPTAKRQLVTIGNLRGGRNQTDPPLSLPLNQGVECVNVDWVDATLCRKRGGAASIGLTGGTAFSGVVGTLIRHVPGASEAAAELWGVDADFTPVKRLTGGTSWADVTMDDAIATEAFSVVGATLNGKLFLAFDTTVDRLHCYDPNLATPRVRRAGLATPAVPTAADTGGAGTLTGARYIRVRWLHATAVADGITYRRSEAGASLLFTPSGANNTVTVTRPTAAGEGETHWEIELSTDNATWYGAYRNDAQNVNAGDAIVIATTTQDLAVGVWTTNLTAFSVSEPAGYYAVPLSVRYLLSDGNRLLLAGRWETSGLTRNSRLWFTPVLGSADDGDDERVTDTATQKNFVDLNENDGGALTGLGGPLNGIPYAFKARQIWKLRPTGDVGSPYLPRKSRDDVGCIAHKSITVGEDQIGRPALYFCSHRGPYRITVDGTVEYLGRDNEDIWRSLNLGATNVIAHSVYHVDRHQWWLWIATGSNNDPDTKMMFDVQLGFPDEHGQIRGGWAEHTSDSAAARCSAMFSNTLAASMSRDLKPYMSRSGATAVLRCDTTATDDAGTAFQAFVKTRPIPVSGGDGRKVRLDEVYLLAAVQSGVTITLTVDRDFAAETVTTTTVLTAAGTETRTLEKFEGSGMGEADYLQLQVGDGAAVANTWTLDALMIPVTTQEDR